MQHFHGLQSKSNSLILSVIVSLLIVAVLVKLSSVNAPKDSVCADECLTVRDKMF